MSTFQFESISLNGGMEWKSSPLETKNQMRNYNLQLNAIFKSFFHFTWVCSAVATEMN